MARPQRVRATREERILASGPLAAKRPGTYEWAVQMKSYMEVLWRNVTLDAERWADHRCRAEAGAIHATLGMATFEDYLRSIGWTPEEEAGRIALAAARTTGEVQARGGDRRSKESNGKVPIESQAVRGRRAGISDRTQSRLDRLAREAPELLEEVRAGRLSAHRACVRAGIIREPTALEVAKRAAVKLSADEWRELVAWREAR